MGTGKTAVLFCRCGTNIANFVDMDALVAWAQQQPEVEVVDIHNLFCSPDGKKRFKEVLADKELDGIVVAACTPKMHEKTFQGLAEELGYNLAAVQMANIREQCAWVTTDKDIATAKARVLINAALERTRHVEALERRSMGVNTDLVVIGGGVAGIETALMAAHAGRKVTIVERDISLGGNVIKTEEVAPNMECAPCLLAPRLAAVRDHPNITVVSNAEVTEVLGFYGNFTVRIHQRARAVKDNCIGCEACFEVCPVEVESSFHLGLGKRKAIHTLFPGSVPAAAVIDKSACRHFTDGSCDACVAACPFGSIDFEQQDQDMEVAAGAVVVATGYRPGSVSRFPELGHGAVENVYTLPEFERIASSNGPLGGEIERAGGREVKSVAVVHCAGSLRDDGIPYCSGICCTGAVKVGELIRKQVPDVTVYNIHNDLVFTDPHQRHFYREQLAAGTVFLTCDDLTSVRVSKGEGGVTVAAAGIEPLEVDMVVLATGLAPAEGTRELASMLNVDLDPSGFFKADHDLLHQTGASLDGIYVAGCAGSPCDVASAVTRGQAAAGDIMSKLVEGREIELEIMTSVIDEQKCAGCKLCVSVCPYKAISYDTEKKVCVINEVICRGCGTCTANCATGASTARHYTDDQIYAEIGGVLNG